VTTNKFKRTGKVKNQLSLEDTIRYCIENKLKMDFFYEDEEDNEKVLKGYRRVSPAALGILKGTHNIAVRAYLNDGVSKTGKEPKWRLFLLKRIKDFNVHYSKFRTHKLFQPGDKGMEIVDTEIKKAFNYLFR
jgi:predicted DNA-binding transcriptional regulator YafY